jgi:hypothetical protein
MARYLAGLALPLLGFAVFSLAMVAREIGPWAALTRPLAEAMRFQDNPYQNLPLTTFGQRLGSLLHYPSALTGSTLGSLVFALVPVAVIIPATRRLRLGIVWWVLGIFLAYYGAIPYKPERFLLFFLPLAAIPTATVMVHASAHARVRRFAALIMVAFGAGLLPALRHDWELVRGAQAPTREEQRALFGYFARQAVTGPILTASPLFCAFSDHRYIPVYQTQGRDHTYMNDWERRLRPDAAAYSDAGFACADLPCLDRRERLFAAVDRSLVASAVHRGPGERWFFFVGRRTGAD